MYMISRISVYKMYANKLSLNMHTVNLDNEVNKSSISVPALPTGAVCDGWTLLCTSGYVCNMAPEHKSHYVLLQAI